jgi:peptide/nickel transport system ATP-binding protein
MTETTATTPTTVPTTGAGPDRPAHALVRVEVCGLRVELEGVPVLRGVDLAAEPGAVHMVLGPSGAGKSTILHALTGMLPRGARTVGSAALEVGGERVDLLAASQAALRRRVRGRLVGAAPQGAGAAFSATRTLGDQLREAQRVAGRPGQRPGLGIAHPHRLAPPAERLAELAHAAGADPAWLARYPHELSGGQLSRLGLVAAMVNHPPVLLADEPTAGLDAETTDVVGTALRTFARSGHAVLVITHDPRLAARFADVVTVLADGRVTAQGAPAEVLSAPPAVRRPRPAPTPSGRRLRARGVTVRKGGRPVLAPSDLELRPGAVVGLTGPSGVGKSTLAAVLGLVDAPDEGAVELAGTRLPGAGLGLDPAVRRRVAWVSQHPHTAVDPRLTLREAVALPARLAGRPADVTALAERCGLPPALLGRRPHQVSGGELQRACVARALALRPEFLVLDEVTSMLDPSTTRDLLALVRAQADEHRTGVLLVSHDVAALRAVADELLVLHAGADGARPVPLDDRATLPPLFDHVPTVGVHDRRGAPEESS